MKNNVGTFDKVIRILIALVFAVLFFTHLVVGALAIILIVFSAILILTTIVGFCPLYFPFGINTCKKKV